MTIQSFNLIQFRRAEAVKATEGGPTMDVTQVNMHVEGMLLAISFTCLPIFLVFHLKNSICLRFLEANKHCVLFQGF